MHNAFIQHDGPSAQGDACFGDLVAHVPERSPAAREAIAALQAVDPDGWHNLVAIRDGRAPTGRTFPPDSWDEIAEWVDAYNGNANCYFTLNEPRPDAADKKLEKAYIVRIRGVGVDLDPIKREDRPLTAAEFADARAELQSRQLSDDGQFSPSFTIDTGNGLQRIWLTAEYLDASVERQWAEECGQALAHALGGDPIQNIDRLFRLPGTGNVLTAKKLSKYPPGFRTASIATIDASRRYSREQITRFAPSFEHVPRNLDRQSDIQGIEHDDAYIARALNEIGTAPGVCGSFRDLDAELQEKLAQVRQTKSQLHRLINGEVEGLLPVAEGKAQSTSRSEFLFSAGVYLYEAGFTAEEFANVVCAWDHVQPHLDEAGDVERALSRVWGKVVRRRDIEISKLVKKWFDPNPPPVDRQSFDRAPTAAGKHFRLLSMQDILDMPAPKFIIDGHIPENGLGFLYGKPGTKKSFIALDWALHIAFQKADWHGYAIDPKANGTVVYIAGEGASGMQARCRAWMQHHSIASEDRATSMFRLIDRSVNFVIGEDQKNLIEDIKSQIAGPVSAVFIDTVSRSVAGADENSQKDMSKFVDACAAVQREFSCFVVGVHHATKQTGEMRGSTVLLGAGDFVFHVEAGKASSASGITPVKLKCEKQKDAPDGRYDEFAFAHIQVDAETSSLVPVRITTRERPRIEASSDLKTEILLAIQAACDAKEPWAKAPKVKYAERGARRRLALDFHMDADAAGDLLAELERDGFIQHGTTDSHSKAQGYKVIRFPDAEAAEIEVHDGEGAFD
ncbi:AAA family ATPase [Rhizobium sp. PL01]|uniref:AAA family ATPase n=1 Tax=Rhizobium sp. PL01 TaxID=3085631 RepID=UPI0029822FC4|nr:AAA family ATPase [Rhizobium sp. PL01]MDW5315506.1 AAA family ATPase [Rhizobium sp. PL01]